MNVSPKQRTQYLQMLRQLLDRVPEGHAVNVQHQFGCHQMKGVNVPCEINGMVREAQAYERTGEEALIVLVHPIEKEPTIPRLVPG